MSGIGGRARLAGKSFPGPALIAVTVLVLLVAAGLFLMKPVLIVRDVQTGKVIKIGPISEGESFELRFIHSVDILPVHDVFVCRGGQLVLEQTRCLSFGAGLGYAGQGVMRGEGKWNVIDKMHRQVGSLPLRVGTIADHTIVYRGEEYHLADYFPPQSLVRVEVVE